MDMVKTGQRLKEGREKLGLTQAALGKRLGVGRDVICRYEKGSREIPLDILTECAKLYNVTTDYLLGLTESSEPIDKGDGSALRAACDYTGLNEDAVRALHDRKERDAHSSSLAKALMGIFDHLRYPEHRTMKYLNDLICSKEIQTILLAFETIEGLLSGFDSVELFGDMLSGLVEREEGKEAAQIAHSATEGYKAAMWAIQDAAITIAKRYCPCSIADLEEIEREYLNRYLHNPDIFEAAMLPGETIDEFTAKLERPQSKNYGDESEAES